MLELFRWLYPLYRHFQRVRVVVLESTYLHNCSVLPASTTWTDSIDEQLTTVDAVHVL